MVFAKSIARDALKNRSIENSNRIDASDREVRADDQFVVAWRVQRRAVGPGRDKCDVFGKSQRCCLGRLSAILNAEIARFCSPLIGSALDGIMPMQ